MEPQPKLSRFRFVIYCLLPAIFWKLLGRKDALDRLAYVPDAMQKSVDEMTKALDEHNAAVIALEQALEARDKAFACYPALGAGMTRVISECCSDEELEEISNRSAEIMTRTNAALLVARKGKKEVDCTSLPEINADFQVRIDTIGEMIEMMKGLSGYQPEEEELSIPSLVAWHDGVILAQAAAVAAEKEESRALAVCHAMMDARERGGYDQLEKDCKEYVNLGRRLGGPQINAAIDRAAGPKKSRFRRGSRRKPG